MYSPSSRRPRRPSLKSPAAFAVLLTTWLSSCASSPDAQIVRERTNELYGGPPGSRSHPIDGPVPDRKEVRAKADLDLYSRFGMFHNAGLRAVYENWRAALERIAQASSLPDPVLTFAQFVEEVQTRTGPQERRYGISQKVPWFGKRRLRGEIAAGAAEELWHQVTAHRQAIRRDIALAFHEYAYLAHSSRITNQVLTILKQLEPVVQRRIRAGGRQEDLLRLQVEIGKVENELRALREVRPALSARLAAVMNWTEGGVLPLPETTPAQPHAVDPAEMIARADSRNPRTRELVQSVATIRTAQDLADRDRWPDFRIGFDYIETGNALSSATRGSGNDPFGVSFGIQLPIQSRRYDAAASEVAHRNAAAQAALQQHRFTLRADIELAAFRLSDAGRQIALYRDTLLPRSRELLTVTRASYRGGTASLLDMLDSERSLLDFELAYWRASRDYLQGEAHLAFHVGGKIR